MIAVARAFTSWTIYDPQKFAGSSSIPAVHDRKEKSSSATRFAMGSEQNGLEVLDIPRITRRRRVHFAEARATVRRRRSAAGARGQNGGELRTDGDLRAVLQTCSARRVRVEGAWQAKRNRRSRWSAPRARGTPTSPTPSRSRSQSAISATALREMEPTDIRTQACVDEHGRHPRTHQFRDRASPARFGRQGRHEPVQHQRSARRGRRSAQPASVRIDAGGDQKGTHDTRATPQSSQHWSSVRPINGGSDAHAALLLRASAVAMVSVGVAPLARARAASAAANARSSSRSSSAARPTA